MAGLAAEPTKGWRKLGLSSRLLLLTILFVMIAEVLIFVPSVANFRNAWLSDRLAAARTAALVLEAAPEEALPEDLIRQLLQNVGAETIALRVKGARRLLAYNDMPPMVRATFDFQTMNAFRSIAESFGILLAGGDRTIRVIDTAAQDGDAVEIVLKEKPLRTRCCASRSISSCCRCSSPASRRRSCSWLFAGLSCGRSRR